jgi:hypothetical protein
MILFVFRDIHATIKYISVPFLQFVILGTVIIAPYKETEFCIETESKPWNGLSISSTFNFLSERDVRKFKTNETLEEWH